MAEKKVVRFFRDVAKRVVSAQISDAKIVRTEKGAGGVESTVTYSTSRCFNVETARFRRGTNFMLVCHFENIAFLFPSHLLRFLRCAPVALALGT